MKTAILLFLIAVLAIGVVALAPAPAFAGGKTNALDIAGGILLADLGRALLVGVFSGGGQVYNPAVYNPRYPGYDPYPECAGPYGPPRRGCEQGAEERRDQLRREEYRRGYEIGRSGRSSY